ncbi:MAG: hypothetical protein E7Z68_06195 [Thermoplasmata archaeon]|jgi:hypothetical protein|nr:hypothetical protein [Thermoplasmata archaeon]
MAIYTSEPHGTSGRDDSRSSDGRSTLQAEELGRAALRGTPPGVSGAGAAAFFPDNERKVVERIRSEGGHAVIRSADLGMGRGDLRLALYRLVKSGAIVRVGPCTWEEAPE